MKVYQRPIRVLVVDDSAFMRKVIRDLLESDPLVEVVAQARNGQQALELIYNENPDVVTLDIEMPVMDGLQTLEILMKQIPKPVIMLSSLTQAGSEQTFRALELGAIDFIQKPNAASMLGSNRFQEELILKVTAAASCRISTILQKSAAETPNSPQQEHFGSGSIIEHKERTFLKTGERAFIANPTYLVAIAVSTGGPKALQSVIPKLPQGFPCAVLVVQHMPPGFTRSLAERLNQLSRVRVKEAEDQEKLEQGTVYIAPGDYHMRVRGHQKKAVIDLTQDPPVNGHRPAADHLFQSLASLEVDEVICVVMTGMGSDGTKGIASLKGKRSAFVLAQNEETCVVYGMPKSASAAGIVDRTVPLDQIADTIINRIGGR